MAFLLFLFWRELWCFKVKESMLFVEQKSLTNTRGNQKWKIPHTVLERWTMCFSLNKNCELKIKLWWVGARDRKKSAFFATFILLERHFFNIWFLSQCIVYWINFRNIYTFTCKTLPHTLLLLIFKNVKSLQCILKGIYINLNRHSGATAESEARRKSTAVLPYFFL